MERSEIEALVEKMLVEKGLSMMEPQTPMGPPGELAVVGSPPDVPSSQGSNATGTFGAPGGQIAVEFKDIQACFHLGRMEMNLIRMWCL